MYIKHLDKREKEMYTPSLEKLNSKDGLNEDFSFKKVQQIFIVEEKNELIAFATCNNFYGHWFLRNCVVAKKHRGKGLQKRLIEERINFLESKKANQVKVTVAPENKYSLKNLIQYGFQIEKKVILKGKEYLRLKKNLTI